MKKILYLVALLVALCTTVTSVYADNALNEAIEYLSAVGIDYEYDAETIQPDQQVTKATFVENVLKLLNMSEIECNNSYYHDVSSDHWAYNSVGVLTELGVLTGNGSKYFYPDKYITRDEAATILVSALGYRLHANNLGGYPTGYIKMASDLDIFKNCTFDKTELTLSNSIIMLRNAVDATLASSNIKGTGFEYSESDYTVLNYYHNKYYDRGILTGCDGVSFKSSQMLNFDKVIIDGIEYTTKITGIIDNIGTEVEFLYEAEEPDSDERELIWLKSRSSNEFLDIQKNEKCRFDSDRYIYYYVPDGEENTKKINLSKGMIVIYNGAISTKNIEDILDLDKYKVRFIKSKGSSVYDIAIIWKYETLVVGNIDLTEQVIYDKFNQGKTLDISDDRERITIEGGKDLEQIESGDILCYYESEDKDFLKIDISKSVVEVVASWIKEYRNQKILISDKGEFVFFDNNAETTVIDGETVKLYLDKNGYIVDVEKLKTDGFPAYLLKVSYDDYDEVLTLKTLDYDGNIVKRQVAKKARLDGEKREFEIINSMLKSDTNTIQQVVILKLDENGMIKSIDTVEVGESETANSTLRCYEKRYTGQYKHHGRLVPKYLISPSTVIFSVPSAGSDDDRDYMVKGKSDLSNDQFYTFDIYRYSEGAIGYEEVVVIKDKNWSLSGSANRIYVLIEDILEVINADEEAVEEVTFNSEGNRLKAITTPEFSLLGIGAKSGDLVQIKTNIRGEITEAEIRYSYGSENRPINTQYNAEPGLRVVYAHEKVGNVLRIGHKSGADFDEVFEMPQDRIVVYDPDAEEKIKKGTMWDILDYAQVGNSCSTIAIQTIDETPYSVVVYK